MKNLPNSSIYSKNDQELLASWLTVIGMIVMYWSPVERHIDQCVHLLFTQNLSDKKKPTRLGSKLDFIKGKLPDQLAKQYKIESLIKLTEATVKIRNVCVHGVLEFYDKDQIKIGKVDGKNVEHMIEIFTIDRERLNKSAENLTVLSNQWNEIASVLV
jgi:hypothetical protein